ncbi:MAG: hypothetical protein ACUVRK_06880 [Spirochaetota bacterium]
MIRQQFIGIIFFTLFLIYSYAHECISIPFVPLRMLAESSIDPCPICQKKLQKQALSQIAKDIFPYRKLNFTASCNLIKTEKTNNNELLLAPNYDTNVVINGIATNLPSIIFRFYTHKQHIIGIDEKDFTSEEIVHIYSNLLDNKPVRAEVIAIPFKYSDFPSIMYISERNALIINCKITSLQQIQ